MDRFTRNVFAIVLVVVIAVTGAAALLMGSTNVESAPVSTLEGVIVGVEAEGLDKVRGFTLRTDDGTTVPFVLGTLENGATFPPGHLAEHQATAQPVKVWYRADRDGRVAVRIEDAP